MLRAAALCLGLAAACAREGSGGQPTAAPGAAVPAAAAAASAAPAPPGGKLSFEAARRLFTERGVQPGQPLPPLSLLDLQGRPADLGAIRAGKPLVLVTCSLTCNVARNQQPRVAELARALGDRAAVVLVYTIEAHPKGSACPYTGSEWVPQANVDDGVLVAQPKSLAERLELARRYARELAGGVTMLVDGIDDSSWRALGEAPNLGLAVGADGVVLARTGWFDAPALEQAVARAVTPR